MPLAIENIGDSPTVQPMISVLHFYKQNGDVMYDSEREFSVNTSDDGRLPCFCKNGQWTSISFTQHGGLPIHQTAIVFEDGKGKTIKKVYGDLVKFARMWGRNIAQQGLLEAYCHAKGIDPHNAIEEPLFPDLEDGD